MKKLFAILLAVTLLASMATVASAESTTTLTTTVPAAAYTLNIPADQEIPFGTAKTDIGAITVTESSGFAEGKNLQVTITYTDFTSKDTNTTIPFELWNAASEELNTNHDSLVKSGGTIEFAGRSDGSVYEYTNADSNVPALTKYTIITINSEDWGKALAGEYVATITFTAEVVAQ